MPPKEEQNPYQIGTIDWSRWEDEHNGEQKINTTVKPAVGKENGTLDANTEVSTPASEPVTPAPAPVAAEPKYIGYGDIISYLEEAKKSAEEKAKNADKRRRLARTHQMVGGIADMGRAIANLIGTANYAPNTYDPTTGMSDKARERYDKALEEREKYKDAALNYALNIGKYKVAKEAAQYEREKDARKEAYNQSRLELQRQKYEDNVKKFEKSLDVKEKELALKEAAQALKEREVEARILYQNGLLSQKAYTAETERIKAESDKITEYERDTFGHATSSTTRYVPSSRGATSTSNNRGTSNNGSWGSLPRG